MKKIPKQEYTAEFKAALVKHAAEVGVAAMARDLGPVEQTLRNRVKAARAGRLNASGAKPVAPEVPNQVWTGDITYIPAAEGWLYLGIVRDLFNREVIGWSMRERMTADLVSDALTMAQFRRKPGAGVLFHSDRYTQQRHGVTQSMNRRGNRWDNALPERFSNSLKNERVHATREAATANLFEYIAGFYNRRHRHSTLGYRSPAPFINDGLSAQRQAQQRPERPAQWRVKNRGPLTSRAPCDVVDKGQSLNRQSSTL